MSSSRRLLIDNIASLSVLQGLNYAAPLITLPYLVRVLQPSNFGMLSFAQGIVLCFAFFTDFGFNFTQTRAIAACGQATESIARIFWSTMYAKTFLMCTSAVALTLLVAFTPKLRETPGLYAVNFLYVIGTTFFPMWLFQGLERIKIAAFLFGTARLLTVPALFLFVRHPQDYVIAGAIQASVEVTASIFAWPVILRRIGLTWYRPSSLDIKNTLKRGWPVFLSASALQVSNLSTIVILGLLAGKIEAGYFSAADKLIKASTAALNPLGQALYPHITAARLRSAVAAFHLIRKTFFIMASLSLCISIATFFWARPVCHLILGKSFENSIIVLQCLSPLPLLFGLASIFGTQTMLVFELDAVLSRIMLLSTAVGLPATVVLSVSFGAPGAAAASVTAAAFMVGAMLFALHSKGMYIWQHPKPNPLPFADASSVSMD